MVKSGPRYYKLLYIRPAAFTRALCVFSFKLLKTFRLDGASISLSSLPLLVLTGQSDHLTPG